MSNQLFTSNVKNLTFGKVSNDNTRVVIARPKNLGITKRLVNIVESYKDKLTQVVGEKCPQSIVLRAPLTFALDLSALLGEVNESCLSSTMALRSILLETIKIARSPINLDRNCVSLIGECFVELRTYENDVNQATELMRIASVPMSSDIQTEASNELLQATISQETNTPPFEDDPDFLAEYPDVEIFHPVLTEKVLTVMKENPQAIGLNTTKPSTNDVILDPTTLGEVVQLNETHGNTTLSETIDGMKELFSMGNLCLPLKDNFELGNNFKKISVHVDRTVYVYDSIDAVDRVPYTFSSKEEFNLIESPVDINKSILDQDWVLESTKIVDSEYLNNITRAKTILKKEDSGRIILKMGKPGFEGEFQELAKNLPDTVQFRGLMSKKTYTRAEIRGLSSTLSSLWSKFKSIKLPTPEHIQMGANLLSTALGVAGSITQNAGLLRGSEIMNMFAQGFVTTSSMTKTSTTTPTAINYRHAIGIIPRLVSIADHYITNDVHSSQSIRMVMKHKSDIIESEYAGAISGDSVRKGDDNMKKLANKLNQRKFIR